MKFQLLTLKEPIALLIPVGVNGSKLVQPSIIIALDISNGFGGWRVYGYYNEANVMAVVSVDVDVRIEMASVRAAQNVSTELFESIDAEAD
jgi:hypothetical protein